MGETEDYTIRDLSSTSSDSSLPEQLTFAAGSNTASLMLTTNLKNDVYDARTLTLIFTDTNGKQFTQPLLISGNVYLNDTGITDYSDGNNFHLGDQPSGDLALQDAAYGLDVIINPNTLINAGGDSEDASRILYKNSRDSDSTDTEYKGRAGFRFVKIDNGGNKLTANSTDHACVKDEVTGLTWQVKGPKNTLSNQETDPSLPDRYLMANKTGREGSLFCSSGSYADEVNFLGACGQTNWVIPSVEQLRSIIDYSKIMDYSSLTIATDHALDSTFFDCAKNECVMTDGDNNSIYWTSSQVKGAESLAWCINLQTGEVKTCNKIEKNKVLVVSSNIPTEFFTQATNDSAESDE